MKTTFLALTTVTLALTAPAFAHEHGGDQHAQHAACIADVTAKSAAAGMPVKDADEACKCLGKGVTENPALMEEIQAAGGLPPQEEARAELKTVVEACMAADQAS
ncbi:MAG: hypothetical protein AAF768_05520 [Pseudomonadota bacterium]